MSTEDLQGITVRNVATTADCVDFLDWLGQRRPILAIDTETTGLKWWEKDFTRLVQFGDGMTGWALDAQEWRGTITEALDKIKAAGDATAWWNIKFDLHALEDDGFPLPDLRRAHDGKIMHHLLDNMAQHGLKPVSDTYWPGASAGQALLKKTMSSNGWTWATVPTDHPHYWAYGALDTVLTARVVGDKLWSPVQPYLGAYDVEMAAQLVLYRAEKRGMRIDAGYTADLLEDWLDEADILRGELLTYGVSNPSSNRAVATALDVEGWEPEEWTETGLPKLDKVILAEVVNRGGVPMEIASRVLRYKRVVKWSQSYLVKFLGDARDGHVHASMNTMAARTGRMSITGIPLQTLPRGPEVRHCVIPEEGSVLYAIDYDGQEARQFASLSNDPAFIQAFLDGLDVHTYTASLAYGKAMETISPDERSTAKNTRYAQMYGAGAEKIAQTAGVEVGVIKDFIQKSDQAFPGIPRFMREVEEVGKLRAAMEGRPYIVSLGGRRIHCEEDKLYKLVNCLIQGSAADLLKRKIVALDAAGLADHIVIPVHDELLFDFPAETATELAEEAKMVMEDHESYAVPLTCEATGPLPTWGTKYEKGNG